MSNFSVDSVRKDFPILARTVHDGKPLVYFDNAATAQRPQCVIDAISQFYAQHNSNIHRGVHQLGEESTLAYEQARKTIAAYINAPSDRCLVFTRGTTESINLVASSFGRHFLKTGDTVLLTVMEHHANIVPWQLLRDAIGIEIAVTPINELGEIDQPAYEKLLEKHHPKLVAFAAASNALGTINPVKAMTAKAHAAGAKVLIDGAQALPHFPVDVQDWDCDFFAFSGHKAFGPTGIGGLYGKLDLLDSMPPYQGGGDMIHRVRFEKTTYAHAPMRFEAGTPNIAGSIGLAAAINYLQNIDFTAAHAHEQKLLTLLHEGLDSVKGVTRIGKAANKVALSSFMIEGVHPHDVATVLDWKCGIAVRAGHHCAQPLMSHLGIHATSRASLAFYNTEAEVHYFIESLGKMIAMFQ